MNILTYYGNPPQNVQESIEKVLTIVEYVDGTTAKLNIDGELNQSDISNRDKIKEIRIGRNVTSIGDNAFEICSNLTNVIIPDSVKYIKDSAFTNCSRLVHIMIPDSVISIGSSAFDSCVSLENVIIGNNVISIGNYAFLFCTTLTNISIPKSVALIGSLAFYNCHNLVNVTFKGNKPTIGTDAIPTSCTIVVDKHSDWKDSVLIPGTFNGCPIKFSENTVATYENEDEQVDVKQLFVLNPLTVKDSASIPNTSTAGISGTLHLVIKPSYVGILNKSITGITIWTRHSGTNYSDFEGYLLVYLNDVKIGCSKKTFCKNSKPNTPIHFEFASPIQITNDVELKCFFSKTEDISGKIVTYIFGIRLNQWTAANFSLYCIGNTKYTPDIIIDYIGKGPKTEQVEYYVQSMTSTTVSDKSNLKKIRMSENVSTIGPDTFRNCIKLEQAIIPNSVTALGQRSFDSCTNLQQISLPNSISSIEDGAFEYCTSLTAVSLGQNVETINQLAFLWNTNLKEITLPHSVKTIGTNAYRKCENVKNIIIPENVTNLGSNAFLDCLLLSSVVFEGNRPSTLGENILQNTASNCTAYVSFLKDWTGETIPSDNFGGSRKIRYIEDAVAKFADGSYIIIDGADVEAGYLVNKYPTLALAKSFHLLNPEIDILGYNALSGCTLLTAATFVEGLGGISEGAFENCSSLTSLIFPSTIYDVDKDVFVGCTGLISRDKSVTFTGRTTYEDLKSIVGNSYHDEVLPEATGLPRRSFDITDNNV